MKNKKNSVIYIGKRIKNMTLQQAFLEGQKEISFGGKVHGVQIGFRYEVTCTKKDGMQIKKFPNQLGDDPAVNQAQVHSWEIEDIKAENDYRRLRFKNNLEKNDDIKRAVNFVKKFCSENKIRKFSDYETMVKFIVQEAEKDLLSDLNRKINRSIEKLKYRK